MSDHITVPAHALHPLVTHEPTRRLLTGPGLPVAHELMSLAPLADGRVVRVAELLDEEADPGLLDPHIRDLLRIGHLRCEGDDAQEVVLDGATGRLFSMDLFEDAPDLIDVIPLAPSVDALARFLGEVDDLSAGRGRFAGATAGRSGTEVVARASELLMAVFTDEDWGVEGWGGAGAPDTWAHPVPPLWRIAAVIRPLALVAGPGDGLCLDLPADPVACLPPSDSDDYRYWPEVFHDEAGGVLHG
ncbi:SUKH-4 family immunity protein [Streptomyces sp. NBC_00102]|uniref:SUKH-4 family immunity protein n=1 Tax=Streptomyces sp. NBC_00102 TaxID=2975652 RepID=UPI002259FF42|nr:SUKH-4 family immunity protein [Streptomyces sp. NBC_00102]MCX5399818.1 SUKH-4 family immunity protein [Streptomyces sp. NBC_00102]